MKPNAEAPWHKESYDRFLDEALPALLAERLPLAGYLVERSGEMAGSVTVSVTGLEGDVTAQYTDIPQPDANGVFTVDGERRVVVPVARDEDLEHADILCVGEQLACFVDERLGQAPDDLPWTEDLLRSWLPLGEWVREFLLKGIIWGKRFDRSARGTTYESLVAGPAWRQGGVCASQRVDDTNWLSRQTHLRRLLLPEYENVFSPAQHGRVCPFETPEGPNIGYILSIANGARIQDGRLEIVDDSPAGMLGLSALMVPFLEHNDGNRQLMGVNMMRQWQVPLEPEPALVQTGYEPDAPGFWCGTNLLTAFVSWGYDTFEDAIAISESAARKFRFENPIEPGDKISNRHGSKGVISRIIPDDEMPHLPDGTPVELLFTFVGCHTRLNFGQIREAVMGRIARAEGSPAVVPPFQAPGVEQIRARLAKLGLPESGMERLRRGRDGELLGGPSTVGWVYWGRTSHDVRKKIHAAASVAGRLNVQGELEYYALRDASAFENILETFNTRSVLRDDADTLPQRVAAGPVEQAPPPTPAFQNLVRRLDAAGIGIRIEDERLAFAFKKPEPPVLELACPVPHPWLRDREITEIGIIENLPAFGKLSDMNRKVSKFRDTSAPATLTGGMIKQLGECVREYFGQLVHRHHVLFKAELPFFGPDGEPGRHRVLFSGRSVVIPGEDLRLDQLGLPEEMAWELFGPFVLRETGDEEAVQSRSKGAERILDSLMERMWIILNRAPSLVPTNEIAFHAVRAPGRAIRVHPMITAAMNMDFDGDQAAVFLPVTEAGQREAGERLSVAGHLRRDPGFFRYFWPRNDAQWGLARMSLTHEGRKRLSELIGMPVTPREGFLTHGETVEILETVRERDDLERTLELMDRLFRLGLEEAKRSGASIDPFLGSSLGLRPAPEGVTKEEWDSYIEEITEFFASSGDFDREDYGPQLLAVKSGSRGSLQHLTRLMAALGVIWRDGEEGPVGIRGCFANGLSPDEVVWHTHGCRRGLRDVTLNLDNYVRAHYGVTGPAEPKGFHVLSRAFRSEHPGIVFARAAAAEEMDPLTDLDSQLFVGLQPKGV